ncbi:MAG: hypothetical protein KDA41_20120 [Planctomycetales bacterium]|nr:hypothetical protein [Planctomycetales bacterium]
MIAFRYRLRTLLLAMLVLGCGLGWWFRPFTAETRWPSGQLQSRTRLRRDVYGTLRTAGRQQFWWASGKLGLSGVSYGQEHSPLMPCWSLAEAEYFLPSGAPCSREEYEWERLCVFIGGAVQSTTGELASYPETDHLPYAPPARVR